MRLCSVRAVSSTVAARLVAALVTLALSSAVVQGASVVLDVPGMDAIFSQASFGSTPIDIRFDAPRAIVAPTYS
jgi:ethanolamine transporter EutH